MLSVEYFKNAITLTNVLKCFNFLTFEEKCFLKIKFWIIFTIQYTQFSYDIYINM